MINTVPDRDVGGGPVTDCPLSDFADDLTVCDTYEETVALLCLYDPENGGPWADPKESPQWTSR